MKKPKLKYRKRPYLTQNQNQTYDLEIGELIYPDGEDEFNYRTNPNPNREEIKELSKKNQLY
ncbi:MAG: hypothetical protein PHX62_07960 [Bacilli bacterium]|nr:hypothetical protein [Bacilli bacterium]